VDELAVEGVEGLRADDFGHGRVVVVDVVVVRVRVVGCGRVGAWRRGYRAARRAPAAALLCVGEEREE
jgi:hypothetical protein